MRQKWMSVKERHDVSMAVNEIDESLELAIEMLTYVKARMADKVAASAEIKRSNHAKLLSELMEMSGTLDSVVEEVTDAISEIEDIDCIIDTSLSQDDSPKEASRNA